MNKPALGLSDIWSRIGQRSRRERLLLLATAVAVVAAPWYSFVAAPLLTERSDLAQQIGKIREINDQLRLQSSEIMARHQADPDRENRLRLERLRTEIQQADARLRQLTFGLIPPREMAQVLENVLLRKTGLRLTKLENIEAIALTAGSDSTLEATDDPDETVPKLYRHGLRLELEGSYMEALDFLRQLENLPYRFVWDGLEIEVMKHPRARIVVTLHTLSLKKGWIGV
jgi:MSHA biogenesis protein MshJ